MADTQLLIRKRLAAIEKRAAQAAADLAVLRQECMHPNVTKNYGADTGNWCKSDDRYWIDYSCPDCKKKWTTDQ